MNRKIAVDVAVIGGGPAGMMAAISAAKRGRKTLLIEKNGRLGKKLLITGKGRCNVTNNCDGDTLIKNVPVNGRFLYSAVSSFSPGDTVEFFESAGVPLKVERGGRVFPESDKASDIAAAMESELKRSGAGVLYSAVLKIEKTEDFDIITENATVAAKSVIIATGGKSYPKTGSSGDGYRFAESFGHTVEKPRPALIPIETAEKDAAEMQGLSLKNVRLKLYRPGKEKPVYDELGEMLFTHFGVSGPLVLSASCYIDGDVLDGSENGGYRLAVDFKPALSEEKLNERILRDFSENTNKSLRNCLGLLLPQKAIPVVLKRIGVSGDKAVNTVTAEERKALIKTVKSLEFRVSGLRPIDEAIITRGGVSVKEIDPKTMESKLVPGLYFAGEVIDVNAFTGGYNLQIAFSTGYKAGCEA